jgi:hypothetical protein
MRPAPDPAGDLAASVERRYFPRITILEQLHSQFVSLDVPVRTCDIGFGGFSIEAPIQFPPGDEHEFLMTRDDGVSILVTARAVHSRAVGDGRAPLFVTGFEFVREDLRTRRVVDDLIEHLQSPPDVL